MTQTETNLIWITLDALVAVDLSYTTGQVATTAPFATTLRHLAEILDVVDFAVNAEDTGQSSDGYVTHCENDRHGIPLWRVRPVDPVAAGEYLATRTILTSSDVGDLSDLERGVVSRLLS